MEAKKVWENILNTMVEQRATEARLKPDTAPEIRLRGLGKKGNHNFEILSGAQINEILKYILEEDMFNKLKNTGSLVFTYDLEGKGAFRCTIFDQPSGPSVIVWPPSSEDQGKELVFREPDIQEAKPEEKIPEVKEDDKEMPAPVKEEKVEKEEKAGKIVLPEDEIQALKQVLSQYKEPKQTEKPVEKQPEKKEEIIIPQPQLPEEKETTKSRRSSSVEVHEVTKDMEKYLEAMARFDASDLHLKAGTRPTYRIGGQLRDIDKPPLSNEEITRMLYEILNPAQIQEFEDKWDLDFAYGIKGAGRFRVNVFVQRGTVSVAARRVKSKVPTFEDLHLPIDIFRKICDLQEGLVLLCGVTGCGKSTTLAAIISYINNTQRSHIITLEDPIEYLYQDNKSIIAQREMGIDCQSFFQGLRHCLRQDPDIILVGEMRDPETFSTALSAAETGHLVFGTVHSSNVPSTIGRILDLFPPDKKDMVRQSLVFNLRGLICQRLVPSCKPGSKVVPMTEILLVNSTAMKIIKEGEDQLLGDLIRGDDEMMDFNQSLHDLVKKELVSVKVALEYSPKPEQLKMALKGIVLSEDKRILKT